MIVFAAGHPNQLLLNPRLSSAEKTVLENLRREFEIQYGPSGYFLIPSSGSSRRSGDSVKLVALASAAVLKAARRFNGYFQASAADSWGLVLPEFHVAGLSIFARAFLTGAPVHRREWKTDGLADWIRENAIAFTSMVPAQVYDLVQAGVACPPTVKKVFIGGGALNSGLRGNAIGLGWPLVETYGMTETCSMIAVGEGENLYRVFPGVQVRSDETLQVQCDSLLTATVQERAGHIVVQSFAADDWFVTEDRVEIRPAGSDTLLRFLGRSYDYIKILGEGVSLAELRERLEAVALRAGIKPASLALLAVEEARAGHELVLVAEETVPAARLTLLVDSFARSGRPYEKITRSLRIQAIPRTELGKLKADELAAIIRERFTKEN